MASIRQQLSALAGSGNASQKERTEK